MKRMTMIFILAGLVTMLNGCFAAKPSMHAEAMAEAPSAMKADSPQQDRMLIWRASLSLEVESVKDAAEQLVDIAKQAGGYVESTSDSGEEYAYVTLRVPVNDLTPVMNSLEGLGKTTSRRISSEDVTDQYVDMDARMKTMIALRDRLRALLDKAQDVQDVLAIEKELGRVQANIDSMQARLKALKGKAELATIDVSLKRKQILGPVGYVLKAVFWSLEKLFVIQE